MVERGRLSVDEERDPGLFELLAHEYAVESHAEYEHYGFPYPGTVRDQPHIWRLAVDCARSAWLAGREEASSDRAREMDRQE